MSLLPVQEAAAGETILDGVNAAVLALPRGKMEVFRAGGHQTISLTGRSMAEMISEGRVGAENRAHCRCTPGVRGLHEPQARGLRHRLQERHHHLPWRWRRDALPSQRGVRLRADATKRRGLRHDDETCRARSATAEVPRWSSSSRSQATTDFGRAREAGERGVLDSEALFAYPGRLRSYRGPRNRQLPPGRRETNWPICATASASRCAMSAANVSTSTTASCSRRTSTPRSIGGGPRSAVARRSLTDRHRGYLRWDPERVFNAHLAVEL